MSAPRRLDSLLIVQLRRVDHALVELKARNEQLRQAELERAARHERLAATQRRRQLEVSRHAESIAGASSRTLSAAELAAAGRRLEWWRIRAQEQQQELESAQAALLHAQTDAAQARLRYQEANARHEGLAQLLEEERRALACETLRVEESDSDESRKHGVVT
jgi:hypothetical protein